MSEEINQKMNIVEKSEVGFGFVFIGRLFFHMTFPTNIPRSSIVIIIEAMSNNLTVSGNNGLGAAKATAGARRTRHMAVVDLTLLWVIIVSNGSTSRPFITPRKNGIENNG